ncbi:DUF881 domain-containing protein [Bifidobacterium vespertilionis]|uniref:DUF881 domain-containing protein n=1 Tax=Bifidobacterium vespertilionis TaxID=2562524 RepID=UPI001BDC6821|nr:DUF881 domain-containing protein [Bifidobacterium vespertilionis]MBT1178889.1 DUF881 domain-containing protein [Bifidobacterium vespertilionis]
MAARRKTGRHGVRRSWLTTVSIVLILALTGYLLAVNVRINRTAYDTSDTAGLVEEQTNRMQQLSGEVNDLSSQIDTLQGLISDSSTTGSSANDAGSGTMLAALTGPGITVTLDDSPLREQAANDPKNVDAYVIHQQDIEAVVNALWNGGAEAMMIMDQRVLASTAVRCVGNTLLLEDKKYAPPYTVSAIGSSRTMIAALNNSEAIKIYKEYVKVYGLGWKVQTVDSLDFPKTSSQLQQLKYATVAESAQPGGSGDQGAVDQGSGDQSAQTNQSAQGTQKGDQ